MTAIVPREDESNPLPPPYVASHRCGLRTVGDKLRKLRV